MTTGELIITELGYRTTVFLRLENFGFSPYEVSRLWQSKRVQEIALHEPKKIIPSEFLLYA